MFRCIDVVQISSGQIIIAVRLCPQTTFFCTPHYLRASFAGFYWHPCVYVCFVYCVSVCVRAKLKTTKLLIRNKYNLWPRHTTLHCRPTMLADNVVGQRKPTADTSRKYGRAYRPTSHAIHVLLAGIGRRSSLFANNVAYVVGRRNDDQQVVWRGH